jgi:FMN phosphatase YigB (HAD superfamily)
MTGHPDTFDPLTEAAIGRLTFTDRPLLILDVDEVVVHMLHHLMPWLASLGMRLDLDSYRLGGNIKHADTGEPVGKDAVHALIQRFFDEEIHRQAAVDHAVAVIARLQARWQVILLTNAPHRHAETRAASLIAQGVTASLLTNDGPKGPPVALMRQLALAAGAPDLVVFVDDSPNNLESVRASAPTVHLIHFIAHEGLRTLVRDVAGVKLKTGDWLAVEACMNRLLDA